MTNIANNHPILVIGLGNPLMADEGIGILLVQKLAHFVKNRDLSGCENVEFYDGGTGGMSLLYKIENRQKVILIDCAKMGTSPGTVRRFTPGEVRTIKQLGHFSLHEIDILKVLELAGRFDSAPKEVILFGIEPASLELNPSPSEIIQQNIPRYLDDIIKELHNS